VFLANLNAAAHGLPLQERCTPLVCLPLRQPPNIEKKCILAKEIVSPIRKLAHIIIKDVTNNQEPGDVIQITQINEYTERIVTTVLQIDIRDGIVVRVRLGKGSLYGVVIVKVNVFV
jgi:hypothetical protein